MNNFIGKSQIQKDLEKYQKLHELKETVRNFVECYDTDNMVFGFNKISNPGELSDGFMNIEYTFDALEEALDSMMDLNSCIQLCGRENVRKYKTGHILPLSECKSDEILNIKTLQLI